MPREQLQRARDIGLDPSSQRGKFADIFRVLTQQSAHQFDRFRGERRQ